MKLKKNEKSIRLVAWEALSKKILLFEIRWIWLLLQDKEAVVVDSLLSMEGMDIKIIYKIVFGILASLWPFNDLWLYPRKVAMQKMMLEKSWMLIHELLPQIIAMDKILNDARHSFELIIIIVGIH